MYLYDGGLASRTPMIDRPMQTFALQVVIYVAVVLSARCIAENTANATKKEQKDHHPHTTRHTRASAADFGQTFVAAFAAVVFEGFPMHISLLLFELIDHLYLANELGVRINKQFWLLHWSILPVRHLHSLCEIYAFLEDLR